MISKVLLNNSRLEFKPSSINLIIGPNHSGKSLFLRELEQSLSSSRSSSNIIKETKLNYSLQGVIESLKKISSLKDNRPEVSRINGIHGLMRASRVLLPQQIVTSPDSPQIRENYTRLFTSNISIAHRTTLLSDVHAASFESGPTGLIQNILRNEEKLEIINNILSTNFEKYLIVDAVTQPGIIKLRVSDTPVPEGIDVLSYKEKTSEYLSKVPFITEMSDGLKSFINFMLATMLTEEKYVLIDEPEAFLHPSIARELGSMLAKNARVNNQQLFITTHSPSFIQGCISSGVDVKILRLTYEDKVGEATLLEADEIKELFQDPMLRSYNVIEALFYKKAVLVEGDADRVFYSEINELFAGTVDIIKDAIFINLNGKQNIPKVVGLLNKLGVKAAAIYDLDFIKEKVLLTKTLDAVNYVDAMREGIKLQRSSVVKLFKKGSDINTGLNILGDVDQKSVNKFCDALEDTGTFLVRGGELESWLSRYKLPKNKISFLDSFFDLLTKGLELDEEKDSIVPFIQRIGKWLNAKNE